MGHGLCRSALKGIWSARTERSSHVHHVSNRDPVLHVSRRGSSLPSLTYCAADPRCRDGACDSRPGIGARKVRVSDQRHLAPTCCDAPSALPQSGPFFMSSILPTGTVIGDLRARIGQMDCLSDHCPLGPPRPDFGPFRRCFDLPRPLTNYVVVVSSVFPKALRAGRGGGLFNLSF